MAARRPASLPPSVHRPRDTSLWKLEVPISPEGALRTASAHDQADRDRRGHPLQVGARCLTQAPLVSSSLVNS